MNQHKFPIDVRWGEMDALGHVNNVEYLRYFEAARIDWFASLGHVIGNPDSGAVILRADCTYLLSAVYPAALQVVTQLKRLGNSSFDLTQRLVDKTESTIYTEAEVTCVWVDRNSQKPIPAPDFIRSLLD